MSNADVVAVAAVTLVSVAIGLWGVRISRSTSDFFVASRTVGPCWNAAAIGGEYLSAAFLGVAGLMLLYGVDMLWYPVGFTAGYLVLLLFVAAPLRRSGRLHTARLRRGAARVARRRGSSVLVVAIGWLYLVPQFQGAGLTLRP